MKKRFFVYQSRLNAAREERARVYTPTCEIRDRATLVPNPDAEGFLMFAVIQTGMTYLDAWTEAKKRNDELTNQAENAK